MVSRVKAKRRNGVRVGLYSVSSGRDMVGGAYCQRHVRCEKCKTGGREEHCQSITSGKVELNYM